MLAEHASLEAFALCQAVRRLAVDLSFDNLANLNQTFNQSINQHFVSLGLNRGVNRQ